MRSVVEGLEARSAITNPINPFPPCCEETEIRLAFAAVDYGTQACSVNARCLTCKTIFILELTSHHSWLNLEITRLS
jgi:hypothetical protein